jgi:4-amino-4-deoxy-L-arabinose transferase-like glycosyltransferase
MTNRASIVRRLGWAVVALTAVLGLVRLGAGDVVDPAEARTIGVVQDVLRGHVLWPTFNDGMIPPDPPGFHWLAAAAVGAAGFGEQVARLPSALAWIGLVALTIALGGQLGAGQIGLVAALLLATTPGLAAAARSARPDVLFATAATAAMLFAWRWLRARRTADARWAFVAATGATLVGGPSAVLLVVGVVAWTLGWRGELGRLRGFLAPLGVAVLVVVCGAWYVGGAQHLGAPFVSRHLGGPQLAHLARAFAWEEPWSRRSVVYHLAFEPIALVRMTLPWTPLVLVALRRWRDARFRRDLRVQFLVTWAAAPLPLFVWSPEKAWSDVLVALPPLALLAGWATLDLLQRWPRPLVVSARAMASAGVVAFAILAGMSLLVYHPGLLARGDRNWIEALVLATGNGGTTVLVLAGLVGGLGAGLVAARLWPLVPPALVALGLAWNAVAQPAVEQATSQLGSLRPFAIAVANVVGPDDPLVFFGRTQRPLVVYLGRVVPSLQRDVRRLSTGAFVILRARAYDTLAAAGRLSPVLLQGGGRMHDGRPGHLVLARVLAPPPPALDDGRRTAALDARPGWSAGVDPL